MTYEKIMTPIRPLLCGSGFQRIFNFQMSIWHLPDLGALEAFRKNSLPGMIAGGLFAFLISFDELIIALFISSPTMSTLPKKLWDGIRTEINPTIAAVSTLLVLLSVIILVGVGLARKYFERKTH